MQRRSLCLAIALGIIFISTAHAMRPRFVTSAVLAAEFSEPSGIIQDEGQFVFTGSSSYYRLKKDGTFRSGPLGLSGREIAGTWKLKDRLFVIEGRWGWINGLSPR